LNTTPVGVWSLVSCEHRFKNGGNFFPFGNNPSGVLIYASEGMMSVMLCASDRKTFSTTGLFEGSVEEKSKAAETFVAYSGTYEFTPSELTLSTDVFISGGKEQTAQLVWKKMRDS
jgi:hypothetical protein